MQKHFLSGKQNKKIQFLHFGYFFYLNQKEKKQKFVSAWIHVSFSPRAWARTQPASARGHQESSITEERNRESS